MSTNATVAPSANHTAIANTPVRGVMPDIVDHEVIMANSRKKKPLAFVRDDDSGLPPVGVGGVKAPPLAGDNEESVAAPVVTQMPLVAIEESLPDLTPAPQPGPSIPPVLPPPAPFPPPPRFKVEFVSDIIDLPVPCHEISWVPESGMLSLVVPEEIKLKLLINQSVTIRCPREMGALGGERVYWFTGIAIPVRIVKAVVLVFGLQADEI